MSVWPPYDTMVIVLTTWHRSGFCQHNDTNLNIIVQIVATNGCYGTILWLLWTYSIIYIDSPVLRRTWIHATVAMDRCYGPTW